MAHTQREIKRLQPQLDEATKSLDSLQAQLEELETVVSTSEDEVFAEFTQRLGYPNIRDYEKRQGSLQQEAAQRKLEFTTQISKLENQLTFETQRLKQTVERIGNLQKNSQRDRELIAGFEAEKLRIQEQMDVVLAELEVLREELESREALREEKNEVVNGLRREVSKRTKDLDETTKTISRLVNLVIHVAFGKVTNEGCRKARSNGTLQVDTLCLGDASWKRLKYLLQMNLLGWIICLSMKPSRLIQMPWTWTKKTRAQARYKRLRCRIMALRLISKNSMTT